jgi:hypothetical protein
MPPDFSLLKRVPAALPEALTVVSKLARNSHDTSLIMIDIFGLFD